MLVNLLSSIYIPIITAFSRKWKTDFSGIISTIYCTYSLLIPTVIMLITCVLTGIALKANSLTDRNVRSLKLRKRKNVRNMHAFLGITVIHFILAALHMIWTLYMTYIHQHDSVYLNTHNILISLLFADCCIKPIIICGTVHMNSYNFIRRSIQSSREHLRQCCFKTCCLKRCEDGLLQ